MAAITLRYVRRSETMLAVETLVWAPAQARVPAKAAAEVRAEKGAGAGAAAEAEVQSSGQHGQMSSARQTCNCCSLRRRVDAGEIVDGHVRSSSPTDLNRLKVPPKGHSQPLRRRTFLYRT